MHRAPRPVDKQNRASQGGSTYKQLQLLFVTRYQRNRGRADVLGDRICTALFPSEQHCPSLCPKNVAVAMLSGRRQTSLVPLLRLI